MKANNMYKLGQSLVTLKSNLIAEVDRIDKIYNEIQDILNMKNKRCPQCYSRDIRCMKNDRVFCKACGFESPKVK